MFPDGQVTFIGSIPIFNTREDSHILPPHLLKISTLTVEYLFRCYFRHVSLYPSAFGENPSFAPTKTLTLSIPKQPFDGSTAYA